MWHKKSSSGSSERGCELVNWSLEEPLWQARRGSDDRWRQLKATFQPTPAAQRLSLKKQKAQLLKTQNSLKWILEYLNWILWISIKKKRLRQSAVPHRCRVFPMIPKSQLYYFSVSICSFVFYCCFEGNCFRLIDKSMRRLIIAALHGSAEGKLSVVM